MTTQRLIAGLALCMLCAACANPPWQKSTTPSNATARKAPVNLAGFPPAYKQGYGDACGSSKDVKRYKADKQYSQGWQDGLAICKSSAKPRTATGGNG